jgi:hypothetical protein
MSARWGIARGFPARELAAYDAGLQARGRLPAAAAPFIAVQVAVAWLAVPLVLLAWWRAARTRDRARLGLVLCVLVGLAANAFATGALSKPHHRYQARIVWLLPFAAALTLLPAAQPSRSARARRAAGRSSEVASQDFVAGNGA